AEERWAPREAPRAGGRNERGAGVQELAAKLRMPYRHPEAAVVKVRLVEVLVLGADRGPRKAVALAGAVDLVGRVLRAVALERVVQLPLEARAVLAQSRIAQRPVEMVGGQQLEQRR